MDDRRHWEERHAGKPPIGAPSRFLRESLRRLHEPGRRARALDLACGAGRHARELAAQGFRTVALDASVTAVRRASEVPGVVGVVADARALPFRPGCFDWIVKTCFLDRTIIDSLAALLAPGGHLLVETFRLAQHERTGHPRREFCLSDGELDRLCREAVPPLWPVNSHESDAGPDGDPPALAGIVARRG